MQITETWREVLEGFYEVSDLGRLRRAKPGGNSRAGKILKQELSNCGYLRVQTSCNKRIEKCCVHSLVAMAFLGKRPNGKVVHHKNEIKTDNRAVNLEYVTPVQNVRLSLDFGSAKRIISHGKSCNRGSANGMAKLTEAAASEIRKLVASGLSYKIVATKFSVCRQTICNVIKAARWRPD